MKFNALQPKAEQLSLDLESMVTDRDLLERLFNQLPCQNLNDVLCLLESEKIESFQDLINYATGPACPEDLAVTIEAIMDRLRKINLHRDINMSSSSEIGKYMSDKLSGQKQEQFWALYFDKQMNLIGEKMLFQGTLDRSWVHPREIFRYGVIYGCSGIIVAHNHPGGSLSPSEPDLEMTKGLTKAGNVMKMKIFDHIIVGGGEYFSLREHDLM